MGNSFVFNARFVSNTRLDRVYRIYAVENDLFFIRIGGQGGIQEGVAAQFGLVGGIIKALLNKHSEKKNLSIIETIDQIPPQQQIAKHKHNFKLNVVEIQNGGIEPQSFFDFHGPHVGHFKINLIDGRKMNFQFDKIEDMQMAVNNIPKQLSRIKINVQWNEWKKRFEKKD